MVKIEKRMVRKKRMVIIVLRTPQKCIYGELKTKGG